MSSTKDEQIHDLRQLKKSHLLEVIPKHAPLWADKGDQGLKKYIQNDHPVFILHKKTKNSPLTPQKKQDNRIIAGLRSVVEHAIAGIKWPQKKQGNRIIAGLRSVVEHAIAGIKRFQALAQTCRCRRGQDDQWMMVASALWNFHLQYRSLSFILISQLSLSFLILIHFFASFYYFNPGLM